MGKKKSNTNRHLYRKPGAKYVVKNAKKSGTIGETATKAVATALYPFYFVGSKIKGLVEDGKNRSHGSIKSTNESKSKFKLNIEQKNVKETARKALGFMKTYRYYIAGATMLIAISAIGFSALSQIEANDTEVALETQQHVVTIPKVTEAEAPEAALTTFDTSETVSMEEITLPEFKVMSFASVKVYQIIVNGNPIAGFKTEEEANLVLEQLKAKFTDVEGSVFKEVYFSEEVKVELEHVDITQFSEYDTVETALEFIIRGTKEEKKHIVQKGENFWVIAQYYDISPYDLEAANPDIKPETIQIGQEVSLVVPKPLISVNTVEEASYSDSIAFDVKYEDSSSLYKGETKTKVNGVYGERAVVAEIIKENGREISRTILSENVIAQPQAKVVYKGTKDPPPRMGTGSLVRPSSRGPVTSEFGVWRSYRRHTGIDVGLSIGTAIKAADGGVVTFSGYSSSYGRYVIIDHGGNMTTLYAHNSSLTVKKGDKVFQGQTIAYSGNTGNSTGPHLHFEVRINGVPKNPRNYVNF